MYGCFCYRLRRIIVTRHLASAASLQIESYATSEQATRIKWIDGKIIFKKTVSFNNPTTDGTVPHGSSIQTPIRIEVIRGVEAIDAGFMHTATTGIFFRFDAANITIRNMGSLSSQSCVATIYYTKP